MIHLFTDTQTRALLGDHHATHSDGLPPHQGWPRGGAPTADAGWNDVRAAMRWDLTHYLPYDVLRKVDRASMAVALEVRCPLLDTRVVEAACRMPSASLMPRGRPKAILRDLAGDLLPRAIARRPKRGFAIPIGRWFQRSLRDAVRDRLLSGSLNDLGFDTQAITALLDQHMTQRADHTHRIFALLTLSLWWEWMHSVTGGGT
jgi:asparagine synthase (glutamine-hydrolysing)